MQRVASHSSQYDAADDDDVEEEFKEGEVPESPLPSISLSPSWEFEPEPRADATPPPQRPRSPAPLSLPPLERVDDPNDDGDGDVRMAAGPMDEDRQAAPDEYESDDNCILAMETPPSSTRRLQPSGMAQKWEPLAAAAEARSSRPFSCSGPPASSVVPVSPLFVPPSPEPEPLSGLGCCGNSVVGRDDVELERQAATVPPALSTPLLLQPAPTQHSRVVIVEPEEWNWPPSPPPPPATPSQSSRPRKQSNTNTCTERRPPSSTPSLSPSSSRSTKAAKKRRRSPSIDLTGDADSDEDSKEERKEEHKEDSKEGIKAAESKEQPPADANKHTKQHKVVATALTTLLHQPHKPDRERRLAISQHVVRHAAKQVGQINRLACMLMSLFVIDRLEKNKPVPLMLSEKNGTIWNWCILIVSKMGGSWKPPLVKGKQDRKKKEQAEEEEEEEEEEKEDEPADGQQQPHSKKRRTEAGESKDRDAEQKRLVKARKTAEASEQQRRDVYADLQHIFDNSIKAQLEPQLPRTTRSPGPTDAASTECLRTR